jgi:DNA-binding transcriptional LysR family regulator
MGGFMEIKQLKIFLSVCEYMSFTKAAKALNYSQSTISDHIKKLEDSLNTKLFNRINRDIFLTDQGKKLIDYARKIIALEREATLEISDTSVKVIHVGILESLVSYKFPAFFRKFLEENTDCRIVFKIARCEALVDLLRKDVVDIAFTLDETIEEKDIQSTLLFEEEIVLALSGKKEINDVKDLNDMNVIISEGDQGYNQLFYNLSNELSIKHGSFIYMESIEGIKNFVKDGFGLTFIPETAIEKELDEKSIQKVIINDQHFHHNVQILIHRDKYIDPKLQQLIDQSIKTYRR